MTVHIGEITSEVVAGATPTASGAVHECDEWSERVSLERMLARLERDRRRTATGHSDD